MLTKSQITEGLDPLVSWATHNLRGSHFTLASKIAGFPIGIFSIKKADHLRNELCFLNIFIIQSCCLTAGVSPKMLTLLAHVVHKTNFPGADSDRWFSLLNDRLKQYTYAFNSPQAGGVLSVAGGFLLNVHSFDRATPTITSQTAVCDFVSHLTHYVQTALSKEPSSLLTHSKASEETSGAADASLGSFENPIVLDPPKDLPASINFLRETLLKMPEHRANPQALTDTMLRGGVSETTKMIYLEQLLGKEGKDFTLGPRSYAPGTSIQRQIVYMAAGGSKILHIDFSRFGERF